MQIKDPGLFSRGKITLAPSAHVTPDALMAELQQVWGTQGFEVYRTALLGADLVLKRSAWTGISLKIKHGPQSTDILFNAFAPSVWVRLFSMGVIPVLILYFKSWTPLLREFAVWAPTSPLLTGQMGAGARPAGQMGQGHQQQGQAPGGGWPQDGQGS